MIEPLADDVPQSPAPDSSYRKTLIALIAVFFLLWFVVPLLTPRFAQIIYTFTLPFRYLGVFVHEMGHGLFTLLSGGRFHWFQMEFGSGGVAITSGGIRAFTLLGGLLGPALLGAFLLVMSTRSKSVKPVLIGLMCFFTIGIYYMIKPVFLQEQENPLLSEWRAGYLVSLMIPGLGFAFTLAVIRRTERVQRFAIQLLGILMCYSGYSDTSYIFEYDPLPNGLYSDARVLASLLGPAPENVPRWLFILTATGISVLNFGCMFFGAGRALRRKKGKPQGFPATPSE